VHLQICLTQTLTGPIGQGRDAVGGEAEQGPHLGGLLTLDLKVPQDQLPTLRQRGESLGGGGVLEMGDGWVNKWDAWVELLKLVGRRNLGVGTDAVDVQSTYGGQQVGAKRQIWAATFEQDAQHLDEGIGDKVLGVAWASDLARQRQCRPSVPFKEHSVGLPIATANCRDEFGVAKRGCSGNKILAHDNDVTRTPPLP